MHPRLACLLLLLLLALRTPLPGQQAPAPAAAVSPQAAARIAEAQELISRDRFVDAQSKLDEAEALSPDNPQIYNLRGTIYLSRPLRDFREAAEMFDKAEAMMPGTPVIAFNKAELQYVKHDWEGARAAFQKMLNEFPKIPEETRHLILFKKLVAEAKLGQTEAAEKTLKENFTFMDDTPAYYYAHAALEFQAGREAKAQEWLAKADGIYKAGQTVAYLDSLKEARWIPDIGLPPAETK